jgi:hypothetical protein
LRREFEIYGTVKKVNTFSKLYEFISIYLVIKKSIIFFLRRKAFIILI